MEVWFSQHNTTVYCKMKQYETDIISAYNGTVDIVQRVV